MMTLHQAVQNYVHHRRKMEQCSLKSISDKFGLGTPDNARRIVKGKKRHDDEDLIREMNEHYHMHLEEAGKKTDIAEEHGIGIHRLDNMIQAVKKEMGA